MKNTNNHNFNKKMRRIYEKNVTDTKGAAKSFCTAIWLKDGQTWVPEELDVIGKHENVEYAVFGQELGPENGNPHWQAYVHLKEPQRASFLCKLTKHMYSAKETFWIKCRGDPKSNFIYCSKKEKKNEDDEYQEDKIYYEYGVLPDSDPKDQGKRGKEAYADALRLAQENKMDELRLTYPQLYTNFRNVYAGEATRPRQNLTILPKACGLWIHGDVGNGKSYAVKTKYPGHFLKNHTHWWCGYTDQKVVIIEEVEPEEAWLLKQLKQWADRDPFQAESKNNGSVMIRPEQIIVISNYAPSQMLLNEITIRTLYDRFEVVKTKGRSKRQKPMVYELEEDADILEFLNKTYPDIS